MDALIGAIEIIGFHVGVLAVVFGPFVLLEIRDSRKK